MTVETERHLEMLEIVKQAHWSIGEWPDAVIQAMDFIDAIGEYVKLNDTLDLGKIQNELEEFALEHVASGAAEVWDNMTVYGEDWGITISGLDGELAKGVSWQDLFPEYEYSSETAAALRELADKMDAHLSEDRPTND